MMKTLPMLCLFAVAISPHAQAASVYLKSATLAGVTLQDASGNPLSAGSSLAGDGTLLEFGYYSAATSATPFAGIWNALTVPDSAGLVVTTIGDAPPWPNGFFSMGLHLDTTLPGFPADGTPIALRFYDGKTRKNSVAFNAVANTSGKWNLDLTAEQTVISIGPDPNIVWQGGPVSAFRTTIPIPESGAAALLATALAAALLVRRRAAGKLQAMHSKVGPT